MEAFQNSPGHQKDNFCMETLQEVTVLQPEGTCGPCRRAVKAYRNLEVVFARGKMTVSLDHVL